VADALDADFFEMTVLEKRENEPRNVVLHEGFGILAKAETGKFLGNVFGAPGQIITHGTDLTCIVRRANCGAQQKRIRNDRQYRTLIPYE
jgi:hypothetical protein